MGFMQHIEEIILLENGGQRNSQEENERKFKISQKKIPALWSRASESGHLVQIFDSVSVIWGLFNIFKKKNRIRWSA
jgi:transcriptional regulator of acetoin/glycerol metabolism